MTLDAVRAMLLRKMKPHAGKRGFGLKPWCRANGVAHTHASEFLRDQRLPANDLLDALGLQWSVTRKSSSSISSKEL